MTTKTLLMLVTAAFFLNACTKNQDAKTTTTDQLKSVRSTWGDTVGYLFFKYDAQDRLVKIIDSNNNGFLSERVMSYNPAGKIQTISVSSNLGSSYQLNFGYNAYDQVASKTYIVTGAPSSTVTYGYDSQGRLVADSLKDGIYLRWANNYTYNQGDNITAVQYSYWNYSTNSIQTYQGATGITYASHLNAYGDLGRLMYLMGDGNWTYLSKNNIQTIQQGPDTLVNNYQFNSAGQLVKMVQTQNSIPDPFIYDFYY